MCDNEKGGVERYIVNRQIYTEELPTKSGYYWVTRDDLPFGTLVSIVVDGLTDSGDIFVFSFGVKQYKLREFCELGEQTLWCGPITEPEDSFQSVTLHRMKSIEFRRL